MEAFRAEFDAVCRALAQTRPTAVNLFGAIERLQAVVAQCPTPDEARARLLAKRTPSARKTTPPTARWQSTAQPSCPQTPAC
jgi:methylthioribose-1-phosphate isomerase